MSLYQGSSIATNGLVFYYDMNNKKSFEGPPSTNDVAAVTWSGDGTNQSHFAAGSTLVTDDNLKYRGLETYLWSPASSLNCYLNGTDFGASTSTEWTFSCYVRRQDGEAIPSMSVYLYTTTADAAAGTITDVGGGWYRIHRTKVGTVAAVSLAGFTGMASNVKYYLSGAMLTKTQYPVYPTSPLATRSNTQSLLDLTGNNTITSSSLTYGTDSFTFNGSTNTLTCGNNSAIAAISGTTAVTVEAWVNLTGYGSTSGYGVITHKGNPWAWLMENPSNRMQIRFGLSISGDVACTDSTTHALNTWYQFVGSYDGTNMRFYRNGVLTNTVAASGTLGGTGISMVVGSFSGAYFSQGQIPVVKIYNRTLSADEVSQNFNALRGRYGI